MSNVIVVYTTENGLKEFRRVPNSLQPSDYDRGVLVGPPDVNILGFDEDKSLALNNALVDAGFIDLKSINGRRADLLRIVQNILDLNPEEARRARHDLLVLYTKDFYPEKFED